ncbi:MAG: LAGLIDADG family homing endonuclease [Nitrososphaeria archaeon]
MEIKVKKEHFKRCSQTVEKKIKIGKYTIYAFKDYYKLIGRTPVGIFKEGTITTNRILFNLGKGIRLEVTANAIRKIFSQERALFYGMMCGDGFISIEGKRRQYLIGLENGHKEVVSLFSEVINKIYGIKTHVNKRKNKDSYGVYISNKDIVLDYLKDPARLSSFVWEIPSQYLDKQGLKEFVKGIFSTDGGVYVKDKKDSCIYLGSVNLEGLNELKEILDKHFGIKSFIKNEHYYVGGQKKLFYRLVISGKTNILKFIEE